MNVQIGEKIILLRAEEPMEGYTAAAHQVTTVERIDGAGVHLPVTSNCRWNRDVTLVVPLEELACQQRFMRLREQVIDGLTFRPEPPTETGHYWFFGKTSRCGKPGLHSVRVHASNSSASVQYWVGGDMQFAGAEFTIVGIWAPQWRPVMPGVNDMQP